MERLLSKKDFLDIQANLYDSMEQILKDGKINDIRYKLVGKKSVYPLQIKGKKFISNKPWRDGMNHTANVNPWLHEIISLKDNIIQELLVCLAYDEIFKEFEKNLNTNLKNIFNERERYFKLAIYGLYSFRENLAFLIFEMFDRPKIKYERYDSNGNRIRPIIKVLSKNDINFHTINEALKYTKYDNLKRINEDEFKPINKKEFKIIQEIFERFNTKECNNIFEKYRHPFTHRSNPGIGCKPLELFNFKEIPIELIDLEFNNTKPKLGISLSGKEEEVIVTFEKAKQDVLDLLNLFIKDFKDLLKDVEMLKVEVENF